MCMLLERFAILDSNLMICISNHIHSTPGDIDLLGYADFFGQIASYGFIVAAADACDVGCTDPSHGAPWTSCGGLPAVDGGMAWSPWYGEALKTIDWAQNMTARGSDPLFQRIDWGAGVGLSGHRCGRAKGYRNYRDNFYLYHVTSPL